jgi:hypothetical protein
MRRALRPAARRGQRRAIALAVFVLAFGVRLYWTMKIQSPMAAIYSDMGQYVSRADALLANKPPNEPRILAIYPWGTHVLLAAEFALVGRHSIRALNVVNALVGAIAAPFTSLLAARFVRSGIVVFAAGALVALWHPHVHHSGFFSSEIWFSAAISIHAWLYARQAERRSGAFGAGIASAIAFVVRPQFIITWALSMLDIGRRYLRKRSQTRPSRLAVVLLAAPLLAIAAFGSVRFHRLTGHWGLISENGAMNRLFADTDVSKLEAKWTAPDGSRWSYWFAPPGKQGPGTETIRFEGYICDPIIMERLRQQRVRGMPLRARLMRWLANASLIVQAKPWPESDFEHVPLRRRLQNGFAVAVYPLLGLALLGLAFLRRHPPARFIVVANLVAVPFVGALFRGEGRYRVPYDPFLIVLALVALHAIVLRTIRLVRRG